MPNTKNSESSFLKPETIYDRHSDMTGISISDMADMISIYYDEIKSIAKNLENADSPLPKSDISNLLDSLLEHSKVGNELTVTFIKRAETFATVKSADLNDIEEETH